MVPVLLGVTLVMFVANNLVPGDPVAMALKGEYTEEEYNQMKSYLGLDQPLPAQYLRYVGRLFRGELGRSYLNDESVRAAILGRLPATMELAFAGVFLALIFAIPVGILSAVKHDTIYDRLSLIGSLGGVSMPSFWFGIVLILLFSLYLGWLPAAGRDGFLDLKHLILPALALGIELIATTTRLTRACMLEVLRENYITTARAKGLHEIVVVFKHALRNSLIPVVTHLGLSLSRQLGGALVIEVVFAWPGIGRLAYEAVLYRDFPMLMGSVFVVALAFVVINLVVDMLYSYLDPRIRYDVSPARA